jgi:lipopolysaccharide heptosyltransferase II
MSEKILVIGPAWIGDMVMAQSLFRLLKLRRADAQIDVVAPAWTEPLLARMPEVDESLFLDVAHGQLGLARRWRLGRRLRERHYDRAIVLPDSFKSAIVAYVAAARRRTGFRGEYRYGLLNDVRHLDKTQSPRRVDRYIALGLEPGETPPNPTPYPRLQASAANAEAWLARHRQAAPNVPVLGICAGAEYGPAKRWPVAHFAEVANAKLAAGWNVWLFGSDKESAVTGEIQALTQRRCLDLTGFTNLGECIDLMSLTTAVVTNDSGLMHIAASLDRKLIAIYGSTDPGYNPPLSAGAKVLYLGISCSPCYERTCPLGHLKCLRDIEPAQVLRHLDAQGS